MKIWEPVEELEFVSLSVDGEIMTPDEDGKYRDIEGVEVQLQYGCTVIGFNLTDSEGAHSILTLTSVSPFQLNAQQSEEEFAGHIISCLQRRFV